MTPEAIDRILEAIGQTFVPAGLDRVALANDIEVAGVEFRLGRHWRTRPADLQKRLDRMARYAQQLADELRDNDVARIALEALPERVRHSLLASGEDLTDILASLTDVLTALKEASTKHADKADRFSAVKSSLGVGDGSAFEWLASVTLRDAFQKHFAREAGVSRDPTTGKVGGPFPRFAMAVLAELGITRNDGRPYTLESVASALQ